VDHICKTHWDEEEEPFLREQVREYLTALVSESTRDFKG
jgi:hypothetical protein